MKRSAPMRDDRRDTCPRQCRFAEMPPVFLPSIIVVRPLIATRASEAALQARPPNSHGNPQRKVRAHRGACERRHQSPSCGADDHSRPTGPTGALPSRSPWYQSGLALASSRLRRSLSRPRRTGAPRRARRTLARLRCPFHSRGAASDHRHHLGDPWIEEHTCTSSMLECRSRNGSAHPNIAYAGSAIPRTVPRERRPKLRLERHLTRTS